MIHRIIEWSLKNRFLVLIVSVMIAGGGIWAIYNVPIDAIPDLSENQVIVFTEWPGRSPQEVEDQITYPLTVNLQGLAGVKVIRSSSSFGFSMINVIFTDDTDLYFARTRILERLNLVQTLLPQGVVPTLGPDATGVGQVFWYVVEGKGYDLGQLRAIQDWYIRYQLNSVPGVAEVASVGGFVRQYQIDIEPNKLHAYDMGIGTVYNAVLRSNINVGGKVIENYGAEYAIRGLGLIKSVKDIEDTVVGSFNGVPVYVKNIGTVQLGPEFRRGVLDREGKEATGGVVIARQGVNTLEIIKKVKEKIEELKPGLPEGVSIVPFYDRSRLIYKATYTLKRALIEEIILVTIAHVLFLRHFRSILIVTIPLPLAILVSFLLMYVFGISSNIMSLGGIAIAIGVLVDAGIVMTENVIRHATTYTAKIKKEGKEPMEVRIAKKGALVEGYLRPDQIINRAYERRILDITLIAAKLVGRPIFFAMVIIILAFVPVFSLQEQEGKLFHPLAFTKTFAMIGSTLLAVSLVPALCTFLVRGKLHEEADNPIMRFLLMLYRPALVWALHNRKKVLTIAGLLLAGALFLTSRIGSEFMPPLDEGDVLYMPITDPAISLTQATELLKKQDVIIKSIPEVESVVGKIGRAETSTDPAPINMTETIINLKEKEHWRKGITKETIIEELDKKLHMTGVSNIWTQPIINRIDMLTTGIRTEVGVKIFGDDLNILQEKAREIEGVLKTIPGAVDIYAEQIIGAPYLEIDIKREAIARYGVSVNDVGDIIESAIGGKNVTTTIEGRQRFPVRIRYARELRDSPDAIKRVFVESPIVSHIPLGQLADIRLVKGPAMISSENGLLRAYVLLNVRGRDVGSFVEEAKRVVAERVKLPPRYFISWSGRYENQIRAKERLQLIVPIVFVAIFVLLYMTYKSFKEAAHVVLAVPFALTGGLFLVYILGYNFSVAVWVGFIALFGTAVQTGVIMVIYLIEAIERRRGKITNREQLFEAVMEGALLRLRPKVMTVSTVVAGLLPIMWSTHTGAEVMKPIAAPVIGGMVSSLLHVLIVTPVIFSWLRERELGKE